MKPDSITLGGAIGGMSLPELKLFAAMFDVVPSQIRRAIKHAETHPPQWPAIKKRLSFEELCKADNRRVQRGKNRRFQLRHRGPCTHPARGVRSKASA